MNASRRELMEAKFGPRETWRCSFADYSRNPDLTMVAMITHFGAVNGHELLKRSRGGSITDMDNVVLLCDFHNEWVEIYPKEAHEMGLAKHAWES